LHPDRSLSTTSSAEPGRVSYKALGSLDQPEFVQFSTPVFQEDTEITGHIVAHLNVSVDPEISTSAGENDIDLFLTLRYISSDGTEVHYTGTAGDPIPLAKGWLRVSLRKVNDKHPKHRDYLPYRDYFSADVQEVKGGAIYGVDVEIWPTNVIAEKGGKIVFEVSSGDTQGSGIFQHTSETDRPKSRFAGMNHLHFGEGLENYVTLPIIPSKE
jgi:predicted acyl esterase